MRLLRSVAGGDLPRNDRGTTLVEMVLYFVLVGTILFAAMIFALQILTIRAVSENRNELTTNRDFIIEKIGAYIREADSINEENSIFDNDAGALSLNKSLATLTPITIFVSNGNLFVQKGTSDPERLNSDFVTVQSLRFHRVTFPKTPDQIVIDGVLASLAADIPNLNKTADIHISFSLRRS